jgi:phosphatidylglycerophosphate synthase
VSDALIAALARRGVHPHAVVLSHAALGVLAAVLIVVGASGAAAAWRVAAATLLLKAVLDNVDGGLARVTGRVTPLGRYLDTGMDLIVTTAL